MEKYTRKIQASYRRNLSKFKVSLTRKKIVILGLIFALIAGVGLAEYAGWPFLAAPLERQLSALMQRKVSFKSGNLVNDGNRKFQVRFFGGFTLKTAQLHITAPVWSKKPYFVDASDITLKLRYIDIWNAYKSQPLRIKNLKAETLDIYVEREANGRASWQFSDKPTDPNEPVKLPIFDQLQIANGLLHIEDVPLKSNIEAKLSFMSQVAKDDKSPLKTSLVKNTVLTAKATGQYKAIPLKIDLVILQ